MSEQIEVFGQDGKSLGVQDREKFYEEARREFRESGKTTRKIKSVRIFIMNSEGRIYLQKRSNLKSENAGLYDKTVGGHVSAGENEMVTVVRECAQELGFPIVVLPENEFDKSIKNIDLDIVGVVKKVDFQENFISARKTAEGDYFVPFICYFFVGYYNGSLLFKDGESSGLETFSLAELDEQISNNPEKFTEDLKVMVRDYRSLLAPLK